MACDLDSLFISNVGVIVGKGDRLRPTKMVLESLSRHDRRRMSEAFYSVQGSSDELKRYFEEVAAPRDATPGEIVELLTASAKHDADTLERAVREFSDVISSFVYYDNMHSAYGEETRTMINDMETDVRRLTSNIEAVIVRLKTHDKEKALQIAFDAALNNAQICRLISSKAESICFKYGNVEGSNVVDVTDTLMTLSDSDDDESFDSNHDSADELDEEVLLNTTNFIAPDDEKSSCEQQINSK